MNLVTLKEYDCMKHPLTFIEGKMEPSLIPNKSIIIRILIDSAD